MSVSGSPEPVDMLSEVAKETLQVSFLRWGSIPDYPDGPDVITRVFIEKEGGRRGRIREGDMTTGAQLGVTQGHKPG